MSHTVQNSLISYLHANASLALFVSLFSDATTADPESLAAFSQARHAGCIQPADHARIRLAGGELDLPRSTNRCGSFARRYG